MTDCGVCVCVSFLQHVSEFSIRVSFLELYNEELFDLLSQGDETGARLRIFEDSARKVCIISIPTTYLHLCRKSG